MGLEGGFFPEAMSLATSQGCRTLRAWSDGCTGVLKAGVLAFCVPASEAEPAEQRAGGCREERPCWTWQKGAEERDRAAVFSPPPSCLSVWLLVTELVVVALPLGRGEAWCCPALLSKSLLVSE